MTIFTIEQLLVEKTKGITSGTPVALPKGVRRTRENIFGILPLLKNKQRYVIQTEPMRVKAGRCVYKRGDHRYLLLLNLDHTELACQQLLEALNVFESWFCERSKGNLEELAFTESKHISITHVLGSSVTLRLHIKLVDGVPISQIFDHTIKDHLVVQSAEELEEMFIEGLWVRLTIALESAWYSIGSYGVIQVLDAIEHGPAPSNRCLKKKQEEPQSMVIEI
ncbi:Hypothetical protein MVR_LOCUS214 [uncultured virus]|nr:Hypothetical protein MVR_LOCUS214 [uncultured virus]